MVIKKIGTLILKTSNNIICYCQNTHQTPITYMLFQTVLPKKQNNITSLDSIDYRYIHVQNKGQAFFTITCNLIQQNIEYSISPLYNSPFPSPANKALKC
jgi:hypothetical protein